MFYNFVQGFGGENNFKTETQFWPLEIDGIVKERTFKDYIEERKKQNVPNHLWSDIFRTTFKLDSHG